jgi:hypothetical protein
MSDRLEAQPVRIGPIIRDVIIVFGLTTVGGFILGLAGGVSSTNSQCSNLALAASNVLLGTIGFVVSGCLAHGNRWRHLSYMALGVWIIGFVNVLFWGASITHWMVSSVLIALMMGLGGALSYIFKGQSA